MGWKLKGAEDIKSMSQKIPAQRLEAIIKGLEEGDIEFVVTGYPIGRGR